MKKTICDMCGIETPPRWTATFDFPHIAAGPVEVVEAAALSAVLVHNDMFEAANKLFSEVGFLDERNSDIWGAMVELNKKDQPIDMLTLSAKLKNMDSYDSTGGAKYLVDLIDRMDDIEINKSLSYDLCELCQRILVTKIEDKDI